MVTGIRHSFLVESLLKTKELIKKTKKKNSYIYQTKNSEKKQ